ncbi:MAG TPA: 3-deoxy-D-manno-octulosonic acid transferase [Gammaproteobacteria bacterium]|nr:3-deoxy-D-manno-octulosonic acid transferase [Gammaproteobacteria bacterium]
MRALYTLAMALIAPIAFGWLGIRSRRQIGEPDAWRERCGHLPAKPHANPVWIHAASLGEAQAAQSLIEALLAREQRPALLITTFSATARQHCRERYGDRAIVAALPYDLPLFVNRLLRDAQPQVAIFVETEIWPNLYRALDRRQVPIAIMSARISSRAFGRYRRFRGLIADSLARVATVGAQTQADAERFIALGAPAARVSVIGNLKFDRQAPAELAEQGAALRREWFCERPVWVAGSTREGEEAILLEAFKAIRQRHPDSALVLVPRHPERASALAALAEAAGFDFRLYSNSRSPLDAAILIVDTVGVLMQFYAAADVVFVGGTLVEIGGHNILEPAILGRPVVTGTHLANWRELAGEMAEAGGLTVVDGAAALADAVGRLLADDEARAQSGAAARASLERNRGATERALNLIDSLVTPRLAREARKRDS